MKIKLTRSNLFIACITVILLFLAVNRLNNILKSEITEGVVIGHKIWENKTFPEDTEISPIVSYKVDDEIYDFTAQRNLKYETGQSIKVIFRKKHPENAYIYSFSGFWLSPILYCLIPIILLSALIFTLISKNDIIVVSFGDKKGIHKINKKNTLNP